MNMGMSIAERMAMQAKAAVASHQAPLKSSTKSVSVSAAQRAAMQANAAKSSAMAKGTPPAPTATPAAVSAAQRMARQANISKQATAATAASATPPESKPTATMSAAERIRKQAIVATVQKRGETKAEVNKDVIDKLRSEYKVFLKKLEAELAKEGPMFFKAKDELPEELPVNGVSTAEGEMVMEAKASEPVGGMPYQATPVIVTETKPATKKAPRQVRRRAKTTNVVA